MLFLLSDGSYGSENRPLINLVAGLRGVVQAFELLAAALESSFKRLNFDVPMPRGVTARER